MVIVVNDNSNPFEEDRLECLSRNLGAHYSRLPSPRNPLEALGRRSHARNIGTKCLDTDIILYLDGDMLLGPKYIKEIKYYHSVLQGIYVRGNRYSIAAAYQVKGMECCLNYVTRRQISKETSPLAYITRPPNVRRKKAYKAAYYDKWAWCASNNLSVRNEHVSQVGYWDENFVGWGEEDIDFSFRLYQLGLSPILLMGDNAVSYHLEHPIDYETNTLTLKENARYLMSKFPQLAEYRKEAYALYNINIEDCLQK